MQLPAATAVHFLSCEPLLEEIDVARWLHDSHCPAGFDAGPCFCVEPRERHVGWVIAGGESGPGHRPMDLEWARSLRLQCAAAGVPFFMKQTSGPRPGMAADALGEVVQEFPR